MRALLLLLILPSLGFSQTSYEDRYAQALRERSVLVVGIGVPLCYVSAITHESPRGFTWQSRPCIIIAAPRDGWMEWVETLPPTADGWEIHEAVKRARRPPPPSQPAQALTVPIAPLRYFYAAPMRSLPAFRSGGGGRGGC
jgi:hypothetical protein